MKKKHKFIWKIFMIIFVILIGFICTFMYFGGIGTGESANLEEFKLYAKETDKISIPQNAKIIALGEATHGNKEFQQIKLDVFKILVEKYGVRSFAIEGDYGGCEQVNEYIHGGEGTAQQAAAAIGFNIYKTDEISKLITYMREYNEKAQDGEDLRFYGFDMQRYMNSVKLLIEECREKGIEITKLESLVNGEGWNEEYDDLTKVEIITQIKLELESFENTEKASHLADMILQNLQLKMNENMNTAIDLRDTLMAENVEWILNQEQERENNRIFITGHNSHIAKWGSYNSMGKILETNIGNGYYAIGTDFYKTKCNLPTPSGKRTNQVFYSHNPLAKAAKKLGFEICWLDFSEIPENTELGNQVKEYLFMGNLGEQYTPFMRLLPPSYRMFQPPAQLYDGMIYVADATPITINMEG